jgi:hypothetical protein
MVANVVGEFIADLLKALLKLLWRKFKACVREYLAFRKWRREEHLYWG